MRKSLILLSLLSLSFFIWSCSDDAGNTENKPTAAFVSKRTTDMANFEASFAINAQKLQNGEITQAELEEITLNNAKNYLTDNKEVIKDGTTDTEIIEQALNLNLTRNQKLYSKK